MHKLCGSIEEEGGFVSNNAANQNDGRRLVTLFVLAVLAWDTPAVVVESTPCTEVYRGGYFFFVPTPAPSFREHG